MNDMIITSPCTGVCKLDEATGWCLGCGRSGDEIADWRTQPACWREAVWDQIPARLTDLGVEGRRLAWTTEAIRSFVVQSLIEQSGTWVMGVVGAVAEFIPAAGEAATVVEDGATITAHTKGGAVRMVIDDDVRALTFDPPGLKTQPRIVLAVKRERGRLPAAPGIQDLGDDGGTLIAGDDTRLYDLGLNRKEARFCVRLGASPARAALDGAATLPFAQALPLIGGAVVAESPTRVIETALGRIEVQGQIPLPGAISPDGPHTHLLPEHIATGRALPVGFDLPRAYLPGAMFYPRRDRD